MWCNPESERSEHESESIVHVFGKGICIKKLKRMFEQSERMRVERASILSRIVLSSAWVIGVILRSRALSPAGGVKAEKSFVTILGQARSFTVSKDVNTSPITTMPNLFMP